MNWDKYNQEDKLAAIAFLFVAIAALSREVPLWIK